LNYGLPPITSIANHNYYFIIQ